MQIDGLDHLVLTVADLETTKAAHPTPGSGDFCFITSQPLDAVSAHLARQHVPVELGPVARTGARGAMTSLYLRDPDSNLIEISSYEDPAA